MADRNESIGVSLALKIGDFIKGLGDARSATQDAAKGMGTALESETTSRLNQLKDRLSGLKNEKPKIEVDTTAVNAVTGRIGELKKQLAELSEKKVSLGDVASIQASEKAIRTAEKEIQRLGTTLSGLGPEGQKAFEQLKLGAKETEGPLSSLKSVTLGMFAAGGMIGAAREFGEVLKGVFEAGKEGLQDEEKLTVAFKGNGQAAKEASENADKLAIKYNIMPGILKEISANAAIVGGATGKFNEDVTELAAGFTKLNVPGLSATAVVRAFTKGAGDPEGAAGLGRLTQSFPQLASALAGITDPAEKARKAMEIMGPQFQMLQAQAGDSANASERMGVAMKVFQESVGKVLYGALATYVIPILSQLVQGLTWVSQAFDHLGPVVKTVLGIIAGLTVALIVATAVEKAHLAAKIASFVQSAKDIVQKTIATAQEWARTAATVAGTLATWAAVAATAALTAAVWLLTSPVGLLILAIVGIGVAVYEAYQHFAPFRNAVDAVWEGLKKLWDTLVAGVKYWAQMEAAMLKLIPGVTELIGAVKSVVSWFGDLFTSEEKATTVSDKHAASVKAVGDAYAEAKKKYDAYAAGIAGKTDEETKDVKQEIDNTTAIIAANLDKLGMTAAQFLAAQKSGFKGMTETQRAAAIEVGNNIQHAQDELKRLHEQESAQEQAKILNKTADDPNAAKKVKDTKDTYAQILSAKITHEKEMYDVGFQTSADTIKNLKDLQATTQAMRDEDFKLNDAQRKQAKNLGITQGEMMRSLRLKSLDEINKAVEEQVKKEQELRKAANIQELSELNKKQEDISNKRNDDIKKTDEYLKKKYGLDYKATQEYTDAIDAIDKKAKDALLQAQRDYDEKLRKQKEDARLKDIDDEKKIAEERAAAVEARDKNSPMKMAEDTLAKKLSLLMIELQREQVVSEGKIAIWRAEQQKKIDLMEDGAAKDKAQADLDLQAAQKTAEAENKIKRDYLAGQSTAETEFAAERLKIIRDNLTKENILFAGAMDGLKTLFSEATKAMISAVNQFFGFEKAGANAMSANDQKLAELDKNKKIAALQAEVRANKISYEEYILQKTKLDEEFAKKQKGNSQSVSDFLKKAEESVVDSVVGAIAKKAEAWIADQVTRLALSLIYKTTDTAASIAQAATVASAWAPAAAAASVASFGAADAAGIAGMTAAYATSSTLAAVPGAADGEYVAGTGGPRQDNHVRRVSAGETIVDADTTKRLGGKDFLGNAKKAASLDDLFKSAMPEKTFRVYSALQQDRGIVPPISPALSSSVIGGGVSADHIAKLVKTMDKLHAVASDLHKNGVDAYIGESHFQDKIRKSGKSVEAAKRLRDKQVLRRSGVSGGGMH